MRTSSASAHACRPCSPSGRGPGGVPKRNRLTWLPGCSTSHLVELGGDDEFEEAPIGEGLYEDLVEAVGELTDVQRLQLVTSLRNGTAWEKLPQWQKNLYIALDS